MTAARSDLMALDPLEMLLDAARFADSIKPEWAKAARKAVAAARLAQPDREAVQTLQKFADLFRSGAHGCDMGCDAAKSLALAIDSLLSGAGTKSDGGCQHPWAYQDHNGVPFCAACGEDWTNCMHPRPSDPSPGPDVREALEQVITNRIDRILEQTDRLFELDADTSDARALNDRAVRELRDILSALTRPLGGFVQGSIATKRSSDPEGSSRTETALAIFSALSKAGIEHSAISCNGVNLFGDRKSIEAARAWLHSHGQIDDLKTNLRHWRDECGKLHSKLAVAETDADAQRDDGLLSGVFF